MTARDQQLLKELERERDPYEYDAELWFRKKPVQPVKVPWRQVYQSKVG